MLWLVLVSLSPSRRLLFNCSVVCDSLGPCGRYSLPCSSVHGISQARILAISFSRGFPALEVGFFTTEPPGNCSQYFTVTLSVAAAAATKSLQSCPILCDPIDSSPPGSTTPGILQARALEWVAISFSNA